MAGPMAPPTRMQLGRIKRQLATARRSSSPPLWGEERSSCSPRSVSTRRISRARRRPFTPPARPAPSPCRSGIGCWT